MKIGNINIALTDFLKFNSEIDKNKENTRRIINCHYLYEFSTPIFNQKKTIAVIMKRYLYFDTQEFYIYQRLGNDWKMVGYTETYME